MHDEILGGKTIIAIYWTLSMLALCKYLQGDFIKF